MRFSSCLPERAGWSFTGRPEGFSVFRNVFGLSEQFFQAGRDDSPYLHFLSLCRFDCPVGWVFGKQSDGRPVFLQAPDQKSAIDGGHDDVAVSGRDRPVDDDGVAFENADAGHGFSFYPEKETGRFVDVEYVVQVDAAVGRIGMRKREDCGHVLF